MDAKPIILGIDPGVSGALALLANGEVHVIDMPVVEVRGKRLIDATAVRRAIMEGFPYLTNMIVLEHVQGVQGSGATSAFSFGRGFGIVEGVVAGLGLPLTLVRPTVWTKALGVSRDKGQHRLTASRLWPQQSQLFARVKDDGRADASLLAHWYELHKGCR
jgi:crossover junction endodeoxyribonuclease RuvC